MKKILAVGAIAAGLVIGGAATAHATTPSEYVTVLWSYPGYPDMTVPQPFVNSYAGADLHVFDATLASVDSCGHAFQIDVYKTTDEHGRSWETLKETGSLLYAHDGGFLAYNAGIGTPYRVITPEEYPCTTPTPEPSSSATPTSPEPSTPTSEQPSSSGSPTPTAEPTVTPSAEPTMNPSSPTPTATPSGGWTSAPTSPTPSASPSPTSTPSAVASSTPSPSSSPTVTATPSAPASVTSSTPNSGSAPSSTSATPSAAPQTRSSASNRELAYTGFNPWLGIGVASVLVLGGIAALVKGQRRA